MTTTGAVDITAMIVTVREQRVLLASDLARIYGVTTKVLDQAVTRNARRFPDDFAFRLGIEEANELQRSRSQSVTLNRGRNIKYPPVVFTEYGALMVASVLNSDRAVAMSLYDVRASVRLRSWVADQREIVSKLTALEARVGSHDRSLQAIIQSLRELMEPPVEPRRRIGFSRGSTRGAARGTARGTARGPA